MAGWRAVPALILLRMGSPAAAPPEPIVDRILPTRVFDTILSIPRVFDTILQGRD